MGTISTGSEHTSGVLEVASGSTSSSNLAQAVQSGLVGAQGSSAAQPATVRSRAATPVQAGRETGSCVLGTCAPLC